MNNEKFNPSDFDEAEPNLGHRARFEQRLDHEIHKKNFTWKWFAVAASASILITIGYTEISRPEIETPSETTANNVQEFPLKEAENFYENSFSQQLNNIAKAYTGTESKEMINESVLLIKELQKEYVELENELKKTGDQRVATAMILNYKSRITILEKLVEQLEYVIQLKTQTNEKINA